MKNKTNKNWGGVIRNWLLIIIIITLIVICNRVDGQRWKDENKGLYPQSIQLSINVRNTALGVRYGYLFQRPIFDMPIGVYATFSQTIHPNPLYINYAWERKYTLGGSTIIGSTFKNKGTHFMGTIGIVYNEHPKSNQNIDRPSGQFTAGYYTTSNIGCDIGMMMQRKHFVGHIKTDVVNWFRYLEIGVGFSFYQLRK